MSEKNETIVNISRSSESTYGKKITTEWKEKNIQTQNEKKNQQTKNPQHFFERALLF